MKRTSLAVLMLIILAGAACRAQDVATIVGTVTDQSGAVVPAARVTLVNQGTDFKRVAETNSSGQYVASSIPTGAYQIMVEKAGFKSAARSGIELHVATTLSVNLQLEVGSETQSISVHAAAPLVQSQTAAVSALVNGRQMVALPLVSRDFTDLVLLTPGAHAGTASNLALGSEPYAMRSGTNFSVNGSTAQGNSYLIDGIYDRSPWVNTLVMVPVVDAIQEYRVMTSNYSAQYGEAAGAVTEVETKSGTNRFHGDAWEFLRNDAFDANTFFNNRAGISRPPFHQNEFGATFGGPLIRNKTFFFGDYQGLRIRQPSTVTSTIPTEAERTMVETGNFSSLPVPIYNPYSVQTMSNGTQARSAFSGNLIPPALLDPAAVKLMELLPAPTSSAATNNFTFNPELAQRTDQFDVRLDQNLGTSDRLFFKYSYDNSDQVEPGLLPSPANAGVPIAPYLSANGSETATTSPLFNQSVTLGYTKSLNSTMINEAHFAVVRWNLNITPLGNPYDTATAIGIPGININNKSGGLPGFTISGFQVLGDNSTFPEDSHITIFQADDTTTKIRGSHTLKAGLLFLRTRFDGFSAFPTRGTFDFNGQFTRQIGGSGSATALADFALGAPDSVTRNILTSTFGMRFWSLAPFIQDSWRVTNRLTWDYGLRWEVDAPPYDVHNHWSNLNLSNGQLQVAGLNSNGRRLRDFDLNTLAPRMGIAYALTSDRKTILRSGFGTSYLYEGQGGGQLYKNPPYYFSQVVQTNINGAPPLTLNEGLPTPAPPALNDEAALSAGSFNAWAFNLKQAQVMQWSIGIQRELSPNLLLDVSYVGTRGLGLISNYNYNQSYPGPGAPGPREPFYTINPKIVSVTYRDNYADSTYNGLQVRLEKRYARGLMFNISYTYASYLSDGGNINGGGNGSLQDARCFRCNWGPEPDDYTHVLVFNHVYELPFGPGRQFLTHGAWAHVLGNWNLNGIWSMNSGARFTPTLGTNVSNSSGGGGQRPNRIASGILPSSQQSINQWFNTSAFVAPPAFTFGNSGTGILTGPGYFDVDLGIIRHFRLSERLGLDYRLEMFNAFNRANFGVPNATIGTASAGVISGTSAARIIQMALKVTF